MSRLKSFTLIELLIVMTIIASLTAGATLNYLSSVKKGRDTRRKTDLKSLQNALEMYYEDNKRYPAEPLPWGSSLCHPSGCATKIYLQSVPRDPVSGVSYDYETDADGTYYRLYARLDNENDQGYGIIQTGYGGTTNCGTGQLCKFAVASFNTTLPTSGPTAGAATNTPIPPTTTRTPTPTTPAPTATTAPTAVPTATRTPTPIPTCPTCPAHMQCYSGICGCSSGWYDCDDVYSNGCESSVSCDILPTPTPACFTAQTQVYLDKNSTVAINNLKLGQQILSFDIKAKTFEPDKIVKLYHRQVDSYYKVELKNSTILEVTGDHPLLKDNYIFTKVKDLKAGDSVITNNLQTVKITKINIIKKAVEVYNLETEKNHTFVVEGVIVHNKAAPPPPKY